MKMIRVLKPVRLISTSLRFISSQQLTKSNNSIIINNNPFLNHHLSTAPFCSMQSTANNPPQPPPSWVHTKDEIIKITTKAIQESRDKLNLIAAIDPKDANFNNVILPMADNDLSTVTAEVLTFYQYVSTDQDIRNAAVEANKLITEYELEVCSRKDIYDIILEAQKNINLEELDDESQRLIEKLLLERRRNGLHLDDHARSTFNSIKNQINNLVIDFQKNLNEEKGKIWFSLEELKGVPEDVISGFEKDDHGKLAMTFKTPDYLPVIQYAISPETRKRASLGYDSRASINVPILQEIIQLRLKAAKALGKANWATHALEIKMAKDTTTVNKFLHDLKDKITPVASKEREALLLLKKEEVHQLGLDTDPDKLYVWDYRYYDRLYTEKNLDLNTDEIKEYFPVSKVVSTILEIYQSLLSVKFYEIKDQKLWFENVSLYAVWDSSSAGEDKAQGEGFLGYLYLDLEPRLNKYGHAAVWGLIPGYTKKDGSRHYPVAAMVANLAKGTEKKPALLSHDSVVTFFHEMGHVFHQLCSKTKYSRFHGTNVSRDFVEAPSQMLENWCWTKDQLSKISQHYIRQEDHLPSSLIDKIINSRDINSGLFNLRQIFFGLYDMYVHTNDIEKDGTDLSKLWCQMRDQISLLDSSPDQQTIVPGQSSFGHIVGGYDAGYYEVDRMEFLIGYLYSQVFSADMYESVFAQDPMSKESGLKYRNEILEPGGSRDELISLKKFLGREPNDQAFLKRLLRNQS
ncbi:hypothetical protein PSTG_01827 [Puccinia striiformis f. sp. tritici PST-78]|uniref:Peptidase M3A/M3B catalytic domain-containing protein n=1 Tax=Puccinia striiformis f. sp. tritici PST-78 TaxID=1165861 RepID=A0A0L0W148_9BASI|nr:hypothetical protein PSTG_01827 [Puccinia striiformis f. sp. tritici PST-78]